MKRGFSLIEVIIAITILSVVIGALIQIKQNNIEYFNLFDRSAKIDSQIALFAIFSDKEKDEKIYLKDKLDFKDDDIRKLYKEGVAEIFNDPLEVQSFESEKITLNINTIVTSIQLKESGNKKIYHFGLEY